MSIVSTSPRWFRAAAPDPSVAGVLECSWWATSSGEHPLVPDGCMDLLWLPTASGRGALWLCGPDTHSWSIDLPPGTSIAGVRFRAGAAPAVFRSRADALVDRRARLSDVLGARTERLLLDRIEHAGEQGRPATRAAVLEDWVRRHAGGGAADPITSAASSLGRGAVSSVDELASGAGLSTRQLHRRFSTSVGYGPAFYARVARLQRFMRLAAQRAGAGLAELAVDAGFADQAHLGRECRALAATTPARLRRDLAATSALLGAVPVRSVQDVPRCEAARWSA